MRSGPAVCGVSSTFFSSSTEPTPTSDAWPAAPDRSCTAPNWRPSTGTMSKGASNGEVSAPCAEPKERLAASSGVAGAWATRSDADSSALACCTSARPWLALESP